MSSRSLRRVLVGSLVLVVLSQGGPVSGEAAGFLEVPEVQSLWASACQWLMAQISPAEEEPAAAVPPKTAAEHKGDTGWTLDPNG